MTARLILFSILLTGFMTGCQSVDKMIDTGDFDDAIVKSHKKLQGKKHKREKIDPGQYPAWRLQAHWIQ